MAEEITLSNINGQVFFRTVPNSKKINLFVDQYPKGIYLLNIRFEKGFVTKKIVIK